MLSRLAAAWRILIQRLSADWLILTAAVVTVVLATVLLASGPIYADAVTLSALQRSLADAPVAEVNVEVTRRTDPEQYDLTDQIATREIEETFTTTGVDVLRHIETDPFDLPIESPDGLVSLASFEYLEEISSHATLSEGAWPKDTGSTVETSLLASAADQLGLVIGDVLVSTNRLDDQHHVVVRVVGMYEIDDATDPFWFDDVLPFAGVTESSSFRTYGPFVVTQESIVNNLAGNRLETDWRAFPHYENLEVEEVGLLRGRVFSLEDRLNTALAEQTVNPSRTSEFSVETGLVTLLGETQTSLTVTRSSVLALLVQLAILAGYALVLTAGLLVGARRTETNLLRSRGASPKQVGALAVFEGVLLTVPAALVAPWLASKALGLLNNVGPLSPVGLTIDPKPTVEAYILAGVAAAGAIFALSWPAYKSAKRFPDSNREERQRGRSAVQRAGVDFALLGLTVVVFWQLQSLGPQISATIRGRFGIDPLLIVAPALGLLAGAVLALRVIPLMARIAERIAAGSRWTVSALSAWQVARRPVRYARSALLLIMAIGIGFYAASFTTTWVQSQKDQAEFDTGGDIRLSPNRRIDGSMPELFLATAHEMIDDVVISMPMMRRTAQLARTGGTEQFMLLDARRSPDVVNIREDLAPDFDHLMAGVADLRPTMANIPLPDDALGLGIVMSASEEWSFPRRFTGPFLRVGFDFRVSAILQDADGLLYKLRLGSIPVNEGRVRLETGLAYPMGDGSSAAPRFPLSLVDIEILSPVPSGKAHEVTVEIEGIYANLGDEGWERQETEMNPEAWDLDLSTVNGLFVQPEIEFSQAKFADALFLDIDPEDLEPNSLKIDINTGMTFAGISPPLFFSVRPHGTELPDTMPIVVSESFLETNATEVGESVRLVNIQIDRDAVILGTIAEFPTVGADTAETILIDLPTFQMMTYGPGVGLDLVSEYWLSTSGENDEPVEAALLASPYNSARLEGAQSRTIALVTNPVALGTIGALTLGFVAAAVFATVGFAVSATVSARQRLKEFALLRALGLSPKQLVSWLSLEQGVLVVLSLALGTLVGVVLTALVLPLVSLTQAGANTVPEVIILFPWAIVLKLELAVLAILGSTVLVMTVLLRRIGLGSLLRLGDE